jgi:hypothetical protein
MDFVARKPVEGTMKTILTYPKRGKPPTVPPGYEPEPGDPFVLRMIWPPCAYHCITDCGTHVCGLLAKKINQVVCKGCEHRYEIPTSS